MKLYTEAQVQVAMRLSLLSQATFEEVVKLLTPIELPNDEEMERNMNLLLRWVLKHYETHTDENGMFCWVNPNGYEFDCIDVVKDYINQNK